MPKLSPCFTPIELEQFLLGRTAHDRSECIEDHLQSCPKCQQQLAALQVEDDLIGSLRRQPRSLTAASLADVSPELVNRLIPRFKGIAHAFEETMSMHASDTDGASPRGLPSVAIPDMDRGDIPAKLGRYEIRGVLGRGGMGTVLHGFDPLLNRSIAIKVLQTEWLAAEGMAERLVREAQAAAAVEHDNIVPIYAVEVLDNNPCIVMPLLKGETLMQRLEGTAGLIPVQEFLRIAREASQGLVAADSAGVIHCDIKAANLWLGAPHDRAEILDVELAIEHREGQRTDGNISGTPGYIAPEQARGLPLDQRTDIFSLGCVFYRMATGEAPFTGEDRYKAFWTVMSPPARPANQINPDLPAELSDLIDAMLSREPGDRPATVAQVVEVLDAVARRRMELHSKTIRRRWWLAICGAAVLSGITVGSWPMLVAPPTAKPVSVTIQSDREPLALRLRRDGEETAVAVSGSRVVSLLPGEYTTHLVDPQPGRELLPRTLVVAAGQPQVIPVVLVGEVSRHELHTRAVTGLAVQRIADQDETPGSPGIWSVGLDRSLAFWNGTKSADQRFTSLPHEAYCLALSPNGQFLATAGGNKQPPSELAIRVWDTRTLQPQATSLEGHSRLIRALLFTSDNQHLISAGADGIWIWDLPTGQHSRLPESDQQTVFATALSQDGRQFLAGSEDGTVRVWDLNARKLQHTQRLGEAAIRCVAFLSNGYLAAGDEGTVWSGDLAGGPPRALFVRPKPVTALAVSATENQLVFGDGAGTVGVWSLKSHTLSYEFRQHRGAVNAVVFVGDGSEVASGGADGTVRLWRLPLP